MDTDLWCPHYYFLVFFDMIYGISFEDILNLITTEDRDGVDFRIDADPKNQFKTTIKIYTKSAKAIAGKVDEPEHSSVKKRTFQRQASILRKV